MTLRLYVYWQYCTFALHRHNMYVLHLSKPVLLLINRYHSAFIMKTFLKQS